MIKNWLIIPSEYAADIDHRLTGCDLQLARRMFIGSYHLQVEKPDYCIGTVPKKSYHFRRLKVAMLNSAGRTKVSRPCSVLTTLCAEGWLIERWTVIGLIP